MRSRSGACVGVSVSVCVTRRRVLRRRRLLRCRTITLMEHLPPVGWAEVATKSDLAAMRVDIEALEYRVLAQMHREITRVIMWFVPTMLSGVGLAFAAARFS